jgi:hypothetical protein
VRSLHSLQVCRGRTGRRSPGALQPEPLLLLLVSGASAQQAPNLRVQSNVVLVPTLVKDAEGHVVYGLTQNDFVIEDNGVEQVVHLDESAESEPASVFHCVWREGLIASFSDSQPAITPGRSVG